MPMTGRNESKRLPTTKRVRNFDPRTPSLRSAKSFRRLRARTNVSATNRRKISAEREAKKSNCWLVFGFRGRSKEVNESSTANSSAIPTASGMMTFFRLEGFIRVGLGADIIAASQRFSPVNQKACPPHYKRTYISKA